LCAVLFLAQAVANAALIKTQYTSESSFLSGGIDTGTDYNEQFQSGNNPATGVQTVTTRDYPIGGGTFEYTLKTDGGAPGDFLYVVSAGSNPSGNAISTTQSGTDLLITFDAGSNNVTSAGANFFITHFDETRVSGTVNVTFIFSDSSSETVGVASTTSGAANFLGYSVQGGTITSIRVHGVANEYITLDNVYAGVNPVPEIPATGIAAALFCLLIGGRALVKARRCVQ
jgi:hypothetical protein